MRVLILLLLVSAAFCSRCSTAPLVNLGVNVSASTQNSNVSGEGNCNRLDNRFETAQPNDYWLSFIAPAVGTYKVTVFTPNWDSWDQVIGVFETCQWFASQCRDEEPPGRLEYVFFCAIRPNQQFYFQIGGFDMSSMGDFDLIVEMTASDCCNSTDLGSALGTVVVNQSTTHLSNSSVTRLGCAQNGDLWYTWTAPANSAYKLTVTTDFDVMVAVFPRCISTRLFCVDAQPAGRPEYLTFPATANVTYYFQLGGFSRSQGWFTLQVNTTAAMEACTEPQSAWTQETCQTATNYTTGPVMGDTFCQYHSQHRHTQSNMEFGPDDWYFSHHPTNPPFCGVLAFPLAVGSSEPQRGQN